jgi:hypothetical protein
LEDFMKVRKILLSPEMLEAWRRWQVMQQRADNLAWELMLGNKPRCGQGWVHLERLAVEASSALKSFEAIAGTEVHSLARVDGVWLIQPKRRKSWTGRKEEATQ